MNRTGAQFNRVSGRIEHGSAVTAKVFTLGNSFELSGQDYYEKNSRQKQNVKENRLRQHEERRRQAKGRAKAEKQRVQQTHNAHLASSKIDRFAYNNAGTAGPGPAPRRTQQQQQQQQQQTQYAPQRNSNVKRGTRNGAKKQPRRNPSNRPPAKTIIQQRQRQQQQQQQQQPISATVDQNNEIGIVAKGQQETNHYDTRRALEQHKSNVSRAKDMQHGGEGGRADDEGVWYTGHNSHNRIEKRLRKHNNKKNNDSNEPAYTQATNTRQPDAYLNILLGKSPPRDEGKQGDWVQPDEGKRSEREQQQQQQQQQQRSPRRSPGSPGTIQKAMALEKELKRRRRLLEIESGMLDNNASNYKGKKEIASRVDHRREKIEAPFDVEPVARRIQRRKEMEKQKMMDGNVTRLIRAVKSVVVELQLMVWDWAKSPTFKSKDVARGRRVALRRKLHRMLDDHRRAVINLVSAVRNWSSDRGMETFIWNGHDVLDLLRRMPTIIGSSSDGAREFMAGTPEAHQAEFGVSFLSEIDGVVDFLGFAIGDGDVVQRIDGAVDCNMMLLTPSDRVRALRLLGETREADHMAASILMVLNNGNLDGNFTDEDEEETFPYNCPEDMPLACRLCHAGERADDGKCQNCGHKGGDNWRVLDQEARVQRYEEEKEWFVEDKEERIRQKAAALAKKKGDKKKPCDIKYNPKISDKDLLKIAKVHRAILTHHLTLQEVKGVSDRDDYSSKVDDEDDGYGEEADNDD